MIALKWATETGELTILQISRATIRKLARPRGAIEGGVRADALCVEEGAPAGCEGRLNAAELLSSVSVSLAIYFRSGLQVWSEEIEATYSARWQVCEQGGRRRGGRGSVR